MSSRSQGRNVLVALSFAVVLVGLSVSRTALERSVAAKSPAAPAGAASAASPTSSVSEAPVFEVDPFWPKPLPNHWLMGSTIGVTVDSRDHVFVIHRQSTLNEATEVSAAADPPTATECCVPAPPVLEFDPEGNLVGHWGGPGPGYEWPESNHGITIDPMDNIWIGGNGPGDSHILKFTRDGKFLKQFGRAGARRNGERGGEPQYVGRSHDRESFGRVAEVAFDESGREAVVADGYLNKRVAVLDAETGAFKRYWGAYGNEPDDRDLGRYDPDAPPSPQFRNPVHCAEPTKDGLVYVCDRANNRVQVFRLDGEYVNEVIVAKETLGSGAAWDVAFSRDPEQTYLYLADGKNEKVYVILRKSLEVLTSFGAGGRQPGQFYGVHSIASDSKGNLYTTETYEGKRVQRFVYMGVAPVTTMDQGVVWPSRSSGEARY